MNATRRTFLQTMAAMTAGSLVPFPIAARAESTSSSMGSHRKLRSFDYQGVRLLEGRLQAQFQTTRNFYLALPDDDILKGFRKGAHLPAPGAEMGGWAEHDTSGVFGQWLSGMARIYRATGDTAMRDKALFLMSEWGKTFSASGNPSALPGETSHYSFDKTLCGLIDLKLYAGSDAALAWTERLTEWGAKNLNRQRVPPSVLLDPSLNRPEAIAGPTELGVEWYTLAENLYRVYAVTGDPKHREFAGFWHYPQYWNRFTTPGPIDIHGLHAYSHVNTLSSAAGAYGDSGDPHFLEVIVKAHDYFHAEQTFATGGFGPVEQLVKPDGSLGRSIEFEASSFETGCGSWAVFKLGRYLLEFTGEARFGDWIEKMVYNGISAALPMADRDNPFFDDIWTQHGWGPDRGRTFYYSDYRLGGARKEYYNACWPCCSGTYLQDVADYHNLIYFHDADSLYVNLFIPSEVRWMHNQMEVKVTQQTQYPEEQTSRLVFTLPASAYFQVKLRVPQWCERAGIRINGEDVSIPARPQTWAVLSREWRHGDQIEFTMPMQLRSVPIDRQHPNLVALAYGPVVLAQEQFPVLAFSKDEPHRQIRLSRRNGHCSSPQDLRARQSLSPSIKLNMRRRIPFTSIYSFQSNRCC